MAIVIVAVQEDAPVETVSACGVNWSKNPMRCEHFDEATIAALRQNQYLSVEDVSDTGGAGPVSGGSAGDAPDEVGGAGGGKVKGGKR